MYWLVFFVSLQLLKMFLLWKFYRFKVVEFIFQFQMIFYFIVGHVHILFEDGLHNNWKKKKTTTILNNLEKKRRLEESKMRNCNKSNQSSDTTLSWKQGNGWRENPFSLNKKTELKIQRQKLYKELSNNYNKICTWPNTLPQDGLWMSFTAILDKKSYNKHNMHMN